MYTIGKVNIFFLRKQNFIQQGSIKLSKYLYFK